MGPLYRGYIGYIWFVHQQLTENQVEEQISKEMESREVALRLTRRISNPRQKTIDRIDWQLGGSAPWVP